MHFFYHIGIVLYSLGIRIAASWNRKAALWVRGRTNLMVDLKEWRANHEGPLLWFHCASLGEFEQGRPLLEAIRKTDPTALILLTFFSPSGYEVRKDYGGADFVCYLPEDTPHKAAQFMETVSPQAVFFVKYEYWANYFFECQRRKIPLFMISAILRPEQRFFGRMRSFWQDVLACVTHFFAQDESTRQLLLSHGFSNVSVTGDTRFDRVGEVVKTSHEIKEIKDFIEGAFCLVGGSTWKADEELIASYMKQARSGKGSKVIIAPHETNEEHIQTLMTAFPGAVRWSQRASADLHEAQVLLIDTIGLLSSLYRYADVVLIGGGFGKGIHNTLEAATWGKPVLFGPNYHKFEEAKGLINSGAALCIQNAAAFIHALNDLQVNTGLRRSMGDQASAYVQAGRGATDRIMTYMHRALRS